jgi:ATP-dependent helicase/DNAse subunit B
LAAAWAALFGPDHLWSASRLEQYRLCPHAFFAHAALRLEAASEPTPGPDARQLGLLLHAVLAEVYTAADDPADAASVHAALPAVAEALFDAAPARYGFRPDALWRVERVHLLERLRAAVDGLTGDGWRPIGHELPFGWGDRADAGGDRAANGAPPLVIEVDGERFRLRGTIDRLDANAAGEVRVVDYKLGGGDLAPGDLVEGRRLQLPLYALAARDAVDAGRAVDGLYWSLWSGKAGTLRLAGFEHESEDGERLAGPEGAAEIARRHVGAVVAAVRAGRFQPAAPRGGCPRWCACADWCWRFAAGRR